MNINKTPIFKYTILYIDDEESNLRIFKSTFRKEFNILLAKSAKEGIKILETNKVDVLITDQRMPEMTGLELLKEINQLFPDIPPNRLMVSGYAAPDEIDEAFSQYHLFKLIFKPWEANELRKTILHAIHNDHE
jgi:response regulator RpfG family c-di-GMP phosphodiesterase